MKLCRYGAPGAEKPGLVDGDGRLRDLSGIRADIGPREISPEGIAALAAVDPASLPEVEGRPRFGVPYSGMGKFICIGLNYSDHAAEAGMAVPDEPIIFLKAPSALSGPDDPIIQPPHSTRLDWEVELGVVIGTTARHVNAADALDFVAGYCVVNDVSERAFQMQSSQWDKGKGCDTFGPVGPFLVTRDEVPDPQNLDMRLDVNGRRMQSGNTRTMIFGVREIIAYCSRYMTLLPGDIIATGTPPGVGMGMKPEPVWLRPGDVVELEIAGLGRQRQQVTAYR
ncbi:2-keto-4-pentenoate hydratase/2-oxohepta-3-ene-1,7-dioic acid hydratase in catechol pathway [Xanthobacter sp. SG618]|uniref:fumarylacetoacetate hydrolase family protein n=1 Tax=Xanthobacter sp. SG618 TaxID=2587121 RepID=UPI00145D7973|nr:fumarylacetoacetate hydrolase family protein [Xanthobacter sp. SG618]NMN58234.1 2-keto-4-pentenoate hydratase/2-oxohepta-3-ene-1,7-dioic acid hydratase in catechol pathway [Xanthobacter sp. SG618]